MSNRNKLGHANAKEGEQRRCHQETSPSGIIVSESWRDSMLQYFKILSFIQNKTDDEFSIYLSNNCSTNQQNKNFS